MMKYFMILFFISLISSCFEDKKNIEYQEKSDIKLIDGDKYIHFKNIDVKKLEYYGGVRMHAILRNDSSTELTTNNFASESKLFHNFIDSLRIGWHELDRSTDEFLSLDSAFNLNKDFQVFSFNNTVVRGYVITQVWPQFYTLRKYFLQ
jgi:hypothetical protein